MEKIIEELRGQLTTLEAKFADLEKRHGTSQGEITALTEMKAGLTAAIADLKAEIEARTIPPAAPNKPDGVRGLTGLADIDGLAGGLNE